MSVRAILQVGSLRVVVGLGALLAACTPAVSKPPPVAPPLAYAGAEPAPRPKRTPAGPAPTRPVLHTYFDTQVTDDYEWLEDATSAETQAFTAAQNALARKTLDALPERPAIRARVASIYGQASPDWPSLR